MHPLDEQPFQQTESVVRLNFEVRGGHFALEGPLLKIFDLRTSYLSSTTLLPWPTDSLAGVHEQSYFYLVDEATGIRTACFDPPTVPGVGRTATINHQGTRIRAVDRLPGKSWTKEPVFY